MIRLIDKGGICPDEGQMPPLIFWTQSIISLILHLTKTYFNMARISPDERIIRMNILVRELETLNKEFKIHISELTNVSFVLQRTLEHIENGGQEDPVQLNALRNRIAELQHVTGSLTQRRNTLNREIAMLKHR